MCWRIWNEFFREEWSGVSEDEPIHYCEFFLLVFAFFHLLLNAHFTAVNHAYVFWFILDAILIGGIFAIFTNNSRSWLVKLMTFIFAVLGMTFLVMGIIGLISQCFSLDVINTFWFISESSIKRTSRLSWQRYVGVLSENAKFVAGFIVYFLLIFVGICMCHVPATVLKRLRKQRRTLPNLSPTMTMVSSLSAASHMEIEPLSMALKNLTPPLVSQV